MARGPILKEVGCTVVTHSEDQLVPQHVNVPFSVHGGLRGQEVEGASAALAAKAAPDHNARRMFDVNDNVTLLVTVR